MKMLLALKANEIESAEAMRKIFAPLEDLRNDINPIRVLHEAVAAANIANTGPILPLLQGVDDDNYSKIAEAAKELLLVN